MLQYKHKLRFKHSSLLTLKRRIFGSNNTNSNCLHDRENGDLSFFHIPRALVKDERFRDLSTEAKLLCGLMLGRISLSLQNGCQYTADYAFIFTLEKI